MKVVTVGRLLTGEANVKFSLNRARYGRPPAELILGSEMRFVFLAPEELTTRGAYLDHKLAKALVRAIPGFKWARPLGRGK